MNERRYAAMWENAVDMCVPVSFDSSKYGCTLNETSVPRSGNYDALRNYLSNECDF